MTHLIQTDTFQTETTEADGTEVGTVEVTLRGKTKRVPARRYAKYGWIFASGIIGRYQTGGKTWPGSIHQTIRDGKVFCERVNFGRNDNHPKFRKENAIWFAEA